MLPAGSSEGAMREWQERAFGFVQSQWQRYVENDFKLPGFPKQAEAFDDMISHSVRNLGTDIMAEDDIKSFGKNTARRRHARA